MNTQGIHRRRTVSHFSRKSRRHTDTVAGNEIEIKLEVPEAALDGLREEMSGPDSTQTSLRAIYYDTAHSDLTRAGMALRARHDGHGWVQTLKAPGSHELGRIEDEVVLAPANADGAAPSVDVARYRSSATRRALSKAFGRAHVKDWPSLHAVFEVPVTRRSRRLRHGASVIELALDEGHICAAGRSRPICELELELVEGNISDLVGLARSWRARWGLWLSTPSKAARGFRLASGELYGPAAAAKELQLGAKPSMGEFTAQVLWSCLRQVMDNASEVAAGSQGDDHVHQLRVGLRRLRTALRELPLLAEERRRVESALVSVFRGLGEQRDRTHVLRQIQPLIEAAGGAPLRVPAGFHEGANPGELVRANEFQDALLSLLLCAEQVRSNTDGRVRRTLRGLLSKLHRQVVRDGTRFDELPTDRQHRVRKRLKRLRYLSEFAAPMYPAKKVDRYLDTLKPAQDALGQYNDRVIAQALYKELVASDPGARFGVDWLKSRRDADAKACRKTLKELRMKNAFWAKI